MRTCLQAATFIWLALALPGCSLPRGPINIDPFVPRWLSHGEISCECPAEPDPLPAADMIGPDNIHPPISKFHPVPTRPVFEPFPR